MYYDIYLADSVDVYYIHQISPVQTSKRNPNVTYFNMKQMYRGVCYRMDVQDVLESAEKSKSPVKISHVKTKTNHYAPGLVDLQLTRNSTIMESKEKFEYQDQTVQSPVVTVSEIKTGNLVGSLITITGHIKVETQPTVLVTTKWSEGQIPVKSAILGDKTGALEFEIWGRFISNVPTDGAYEVKNCKVKEWPAGIYKLTTASHTIFKTSEVKFSVLYDVVDVPKFKEADFPPLAVERIEYKFVCFKCHASSLWDNNVTPLFKCECGLSSLKSTAKKHVSVRATFIVDDNPTSIAINQLECN